MKLVLTCMTIVLGLTLLTFERLFVEKVDADGVLTNSLFLPAGALLVLAGALLIAIRLLRRLTGRQGR